MTNQRYYDIVAEELQRKFFRPGLWARAVAETGGEGDSTRAFYIRLRVTELIKIEKTDRAAEKAHAEKQKQEARDKEWEKQIRFQKRRAERWTKCSRCGYVGSMFWTLSLNTVKCPECRHRFSWYDYTAV